MKAAAIQMVSSTNVGVNRREARRLLERAAGEGAELAVLPEYFCLLGMKDTDKLAIAETPGDGPLQDFLATCARDFKLWIAGGTLPLKTAEADRAFNTTLAYNPAGEQVARYDKIHLFRFDDGQQRFDEARVLQRGTTPVAFDLPSTDGHTWRVGMSICYDLRFPELYRALAADLLLVPSAFTHITGQAHWELLLRARAVENLAYVLAAAQGGVHDNGRRTWGHSMVVGPWGAVLAQQAEGAGVVIADILKSQLDAERLRLPALTHRVPLGGDAAP
ncbi:MAG: carbon-nitrogen hydrolase family protein [Comamonadaceae bacterium]|nr:MAG: carbon-nitrogen hydrolase family protein [Comamonadaceae bacterium]